MRKIKVYHVHMESNLSLYKQRLNLQRAVFSLIDHEDAMVATVYKAINYDLKEYVLKICENPDYLFREIYFLMHFAGTLPVPRIIQIIEPKTHLAGALLMDCLPGTVLKKKDLNDSLALKLGSLLARIHQNRAPAYGDPTSPQTLNLDPSAPFAQKFEEGLAECSGHLPKELIKQARDYFQNRLDLLNSVDGPCFIHRDFRPGNVIVFNEKLQGIIDWSSGRFGFAEEDFCSLEHGEWGTQLSIKKSFLKGYAKIRPIPNYMIIMPLLLLSKAVATIGFTVKRDIWRSTQANLYAYHRRYIEEFFKITN